MLFINAIKDRLHAGLFSKQEIRCSSLLSRHKQSRQARFRAKSFSSTLHFTVRLRLSCLLWPQSRSSHSLPHPASTLRSDPCAHTPWSWDFTQPALGLSLILSCSPALSPRTALRTPQIFRCCTLPLPELFTAVLRWCGTYCQSTLRVHSWQIRGSARSRLRYSSPARDGSTYLFESSCPI
jgi:hypothetical protein